MIPQEVFVVQCAPLFGCKPRSYPCIGVSLKCPGNLLVLFKKKEQAKVHLLFGGQHLLDTMSCWVRNVQDRKKTLKDWLQVFQNFLKTCFEAKRSAAGFAKLSQFPQLNLRTENGCWKKTQHPLSHVSMELKKWVLDMIFQHLFFQAKTFQGLYCKY